MKADLIKRILPAAFCAVLAATSARAIALQTAPPTWTDTTQAADPIEGLWSSQVTITNCDTGQVMRSFKALNLFIRGGAVVDTDSQPATMHGPAFGIWARSGSDQYTSTFEFYRFNPDGSLAGIQQIGRTITLAGDDQSFTSTIDVSILDVNGNLLGSACGIETATREPQP